MFNVLVDTREKHPLFLNSKLINKVIPYKLDTGDYTIQGHENNLCIERKGCTGELAANIVEKRFQNEIERMSNIKHSYLLLEFSIDNVFSFPKNSGIPKYRQKYIRISSKFLISRINKYERDYGINIIYGGDRGGAEQECIRIMTEYYEKYINI